MNHDTAPIPLRQQGEPSARAFLGPMLAGGPPPLAGSLYVHIPFCTHKCSYCDFYSIVDGRGRMDAFVERLGREMAAMSPLGGAIGTVFVGGGTPTLLGAERWRRLLGRLLDLFDLTPGCEFTVETNPETVDEALLDVLRAGGVNRLSLGAQSFNQRHLDALEREHEPASVGRTVGMARAAGFERVSLDLIFAIPGQTLGEWDADLDAALGLGVDHLSCYALTYEPGTGLTARRDRGLVEQADADVEAQMYEHAVARLRGAGFARYEVSNFARPGQECRHNEAYWRGGGWLACGPSASGHLGGHRWKNSARLGDYLRVDDAGFAPVCEHEGPDRRRALAERIMLGLRLSEGLDAGAVLEEARKIDPESPGRLERVRDEMRRRGWLEPGEGRWVLTNAGFLFADGVASEMMGAIGS